MENLMILVLLGAGFLWWRWQRGAALASREEELIASAADMEQVTAEIQQLQTQFTVAAEQGNYPEAIRACERSLELVDDAFQGDPELVLPMLEALVNLHEMAATPEQSLDVLARIIDMRESLLPAQADELCSALSRLARLHLGRGEHGDARRLFKRELDLRRRHGMGDTPQALQALRGLIAVSRDDAVVADGFRREIRETARRMPREQVETLVSAAQEEFSRELAAGRNHDAWMQVDDAALLSEVVLGPEHDITLTNRANLAEMLRRNHRYEEADRLFRDVIAQQEKMPGDGQGLNALYGNMALLCDELGRSSEAAEWRQRQTCLLQGAVDGNGGMAGLSVSSRFNALNNLAVSHSRQGNENEAAKVFAEAVALAPEGAEIAPTLWADVMNNYGGTLLTLKRLPDAGRIYQKVITQKKAGMEIPPVQISSTLNGLGMVYDHLGKLPQAQDMFERALAIKEKHLAADDVALETGRHNLGSIDARLGNMARAAEMATLVLASREKRLGKHHPDTQTALLNLRSVAVQLQLRKSATREAVETLMVNVTAGELRRYATFDFGRARDESVSMVLVPEQDSLSLQYKLARALPPGWRCFVGSTRWLGTEKHDGKAELVAIKSDSQFDCLRVARTDAINHGMETEDVIRTLEDYHQRFGIRIVAAATDSVEFQLLRAPEDTDAFAAELLEFCMDLEDVSLIMPMLVAPSRLVSLWWD